MRRASRMDFLCVSPSRIRGDARARIIGVRRLRWKEGGGSVASVMAVMVVCGRRRLSWLPASGNRVGVAGGIVIGAWRVRRGALGWLGDVGSHGSRRLVTASRAGGGEAWRGRSGDLELVVAEVGDELEGAARGGGEAAGLVSGGGVTALGPQARATEAPVVAATCSWVRPRRLRIPASRQLRASSSSAMAAASRACWPRLFRRRAPGGRSRATGTRCSRDRLLPVPGNVVVVQLLSVGDRPGRSRDDGCRA
jgi:hypothetical protein